MSGKCAEHVRKMSGHVCQGHVKKMCEKLTEKTLENVWKMSGKCTHTDVPELLLSLKCLENVGEKNRGPFKCPKNVWKMSEKCQEK